MTYLMNTNGVWEASKKTLIFIVGLHKEVEVLLGLERKSQTKHTRKLCVRKSVTLNLDKKVKTRGGNNTQIRNGHR